MDRDKIKSTTLLRVMGQFQSVILIKNSMRKRKEALGFLLKVPPKRQTQSQTARILRRLVGLDKVQDVNPGGDDPQYIVKTPVKPKAAKPIKQPEILEGPRTVSLEEQTRRGQARRDQRDRRNQRTDAPDTWVDQLGPLHEPPPETKGNQGGSVWSRDTTKPPPAPPPQQNQGGGDNRGGGSVWSRDTTKPPPPPAKGGNDDDDNGGTNASGGDSKVPW